MKFNQGYIDEYEKIIKTTQLQKGYQEFIKLFRYLRNRLQSEMPEYMFSSGIVENNMDYSYFQFTNNVLKDLRLKIVIVFLHAEFKYEIWLSGYNRKTQSTYYEKLKKEKLVFELTKDPCRLDYILKEPLINDPDCSDIEKMFSTIKSKTLYFINELLKIIM